MTLAKRFPKENMLPVPNDLEDFNILDNLGKLRSNIFVFIEFKATLLT